MKAQLQAWTAANGLTFDYASEDYANLRQDFTPGVTHIVLVPVKETDTINEHGVVESRLTEGFFIAGRVSDLDEARSAANLLNTSLGDGKYEKYIAPIKAQLQSLVEYLSACDSEMTILQWAKIEFVNKFNVNMDGVQVSFRVREDNP